MRNLEFSVRRLLMAGLLVGGTALGARHVAEATETGNEHGSGRTPALTEPELVPTLHQINQLEIDAGKLAEDNGSAQAVKDYGEMLQRDHDAADRKLKDFADRNKLDLAATLPTSVSRDLQRARDEIQTLEGVKGTEFDRRFARALESDHLRALHLVEAARPQISDPELTALLDELEPTLRAHGRAAANILKGGRGMSSGEEPTPPSSGPSRSVPTTK